jgi:NAD(P)-dependent dehydrogenase (short-subunit alcohol dehydrogenase family)
VLQPVASEMVTGRFTQAGEVVGVVLFPASDRAGSITGADFTIDGGLGPSLVAGSGAWLVHI